MNALTATNRHTEPCPLDSTIQILSGKWKSIILCRLMKKDQHFTELLVSLTGCTRRMLALQLKQLLDDQIITKTIDKETSPITTSYRLTPLGKSLIPVIMTMDDWGQHYLNQLKLAEK
ncbi:winged helix-turn-helix transcriptional regulator [Lactiplantibacillus nangangensis]|uniref:Winged helix-turn-helix transcriptional regulator n=1 Tax=Lactiplantibacillus nangangensis TaxID=2559917 RepID=A0ABW1SJU5_9LACO|nr:helix-turn-helix domain-containing protein [Lactiplantibacillus nangangensis]